ncbi:MAG: methyltransferase domain-containing protein [Gemmataceae bacterium]|nr:methyltransferase domain-containing protein [Gemmataceae bacterium]
MDRQQKALRHIDKTGRGVEIGPSHNPLVPKREGYHVHIIDHMSRQQLIAKYEDHKVDLGNIEEVDFVWSGQSFADLTGKRKYYDWVIASHLIEHTPDLIGFLNNCDSILKDDGVVSLVIPDKRYCFDYYRPITGLARIIDSHLQQNKIHSAGTVAEYFLNVVSRDRQIAWGAGAGGALNFVHTLDDATSGMKTVLQDKAYLDVHAWCFTPHSFRLIVHDLCSLGLIGFREVDFLPTAGHEFFVTLSRSGKGINQSRLELLDMIDTELSQAASESRCRSLSMKGFGLIRLLRRLKRRFT